MATIRWTYQSTNKRGSDYYPRPSRRPTDVPAAEQIIKHLGASRYTLVKGLERVQNQGLLTVHRLSRVDTGLMRRSVIGTRELTGDRLLITFGWENDYPHYAKYQEFGTARIKPMLAVYTAFHTAVPQVQKLIRR